ncbi:hypothetical protein GJ496_011609 [Pomphorhynchus laevis]|nr:hypothetical protein GJ496_011609 [Pomphorhynchus laevis]
MGLFRLIEMIRTTDKCNFCISHSISESTIKQILNSIISVRFHNGFDLLVNVINSATLDKLKMLRHK